jgi:FADH2 O2-dependent halogenase
MWVIPFNNHARATNPLVSVGLNLDPRIHPPFEGTPQEEFDDFLRRFPDVAKQFSGAAAVRPWVRTGRLQYSSSQTMGERWCLTSHAAGFVDALFSRGLSNTFEIVNALGWRVLDALRDDDFSEQRFAPVQELEQSLIDFNDDLVANAYTSFGDFRLWDAWFRVWSLGQRLSTFEVNRAYSRYLDSHDAADLSHLAAIAPQGSIPDHGPTRELMASVSRRVRAVQDADADPGRAADGILHDLSTADFVPPAFALDDPENRWFVASPPKIIKTLRWARTQAPAPIGELVYDGLTLFIRKRFSRAEFDLVEELKHKAAEWPIVGRRLRVPTVAR